MDVEVIRCVQSMLSRDHRSKKENLLTSVLKTSTSPETIKVFFSKRRDLNDLLEFIRIEKFKERCFNNPHMPLVIKNHIRHCVLNPYLKRNVYVKLEPQAQFEEWFHYVSNNLSYVLQRISEDDGEFVLENGWCLLARKYAEKFEQNYRQDMPDDSIWLSARVVATRYIGMGHFHMLGFFPETSQFFRVHEGGSNCYDRYDNHKRVKSMTDILESERVQESILLEECEIYH